MAAEIRNPKPEGPKEIRNPNTEIRNGRVVASALPSGLRISGLGLLSGLRFSDFPSYRLPLLEPQVLRNQFGAEAFVLQQGEADTAALQDLLQLAQVLPEQMAAQVLI